MLLGAGEVASMSHNYEFTAQCISNKASLIEIDKKPFLMLKKTLKNKWDILIEEHQKLVDRKIEMVLQKKSFDHKLTIG